MNKTWFLLFVFTLLFCSRISATAYSALEAKTLLVSANSLTTPTSVSLIVTKNGVGIRTLLPEAKLSISTTGVELTGLAFSHVLRLNGGELPATVGSELALTSLGCLSGNNSFLGIRGIRVSNGSNWYSSAIGIGTDVDNTIRAPSGTVNYFFLTSSNVGIGTSTPAYDLTVNGVIKNAKWNATEVMKNVIGTTGSGASVISTNDFTSHGGTLRIFASGSGFYPSSFGLIAVTVYIMDSAGTTVVSTLGDLTVYTNETGSHKAFVPRTFIKTGFPAGTYKIKFVAAATTALDYNDSFNCTVIEFPF